MIKMTNTPNLSGVKITGNFNDLYELVEAFYQIAIDEFSDKHKEYINISMRLLGLSYEVRHAYQGDREIEFVDNGMHKEAMKMQGHITPETNVEYACHYLYPEMFFCMLVINELILLRIKDITKSKYLYNEPFHQKVIWDKTITTLRAFQSAFSECVRETLTEQSFRIWIKEINTQHTMIRDILMQYMDIINVEYLALEKESRLKSFNKVTKRITRFYTNEDYIGLRNGIYAYAEKNNCDISAVIPSDITYPENIEW